MGSRTSNCFAITKRRRVAALQKELGDQIRSAGGQPAGIMSATVSTIRHVPGFDVLKPLSIGTLLFLMLPLVFLPLLSIFIFGTSKGLASFWAALTTPEAVF